jgi:hypothetical protein
MKLSSLAVAASLALASVAAQALTISYSDAFGSPPVPFSETLTLPKFNSSFGTLIGAKLTLAFDIVASVEVINLGNSPASFDSASAAFPVSATSNGIDATSVAATATANSLGGNVNPGVDNRFIQGGLTASGSAIQTVGPSGLPSYIGGSSDTITFALSALEGSYNGVGPTSLLFGGSGNAAGTLTVEYDYTASTSPIPEPSTAVLMGLGMLAIGASLRRRRSEG